MDLQFFEFELVGGILNLYHNLSFVENFENSMYNIYANCVVLLVKGKGLFFFIFLITCFAYDQH